MDAIITYLLDEAKKRMGKEAEILRKAAGLIGSEMAFVRAQAPAGLDEVSKTELVAKAREMGIKGFSKMTKAELVKAIQGVTQRETVKPEPAGRSEKEEHRFQELSQMTKKDLLGIAGGWVTGAYSMNKADLVEGILDAERKAAAHRASLPGPSEWTRERLAPLTIFDLRGLSDPYLGPMSGDKEELIDWLVDKGKRLRAAPPRKA